MKLKKNNLLIFKKLTLLWNAWRPGQKWLWRYVIISIFVVQLLSYVWLLVIPWTVAHQDFLSFTNSQNLLKLMCIELVISSKHLILCRPLFPLPSIFPASGSFPMCWLFASGDQSIGASTSASELLMNIQGWFCLGLTGLIFLLSKGLSKVCSSTSLKSSIL